MYSKLEFGLFTIHLQFICFPLLLLVHLILLMSYRQKNFNFFYNNISLITMKHQFIFSI